MHLRQQILAGKNVVATQARHVQILVNDVLQTVEQGVFSTVAELHDDENIGTAARPSLPVGKFDYPDTVEQDGPGHLIQAVYEHEGRDCGINEGRLAETPTRESVTRSEGRFSHDYNARGNWVDSPA